MSEPERLRRCLRRSRLLAHLAPYIEKVATGAPGSRSPELLRLANEDLAEAVGAEGRGAGSCAESRRCPSSRLRAELAAARVLGLLPPRPALSRGLRDAADAPWALIGRGDPALLERLEPDGAVTVVGVPAGQRLRARGRRATSAASWPRPGWSSSAAWRSGSTPAPIAARSRPGTTVAVLGCGADVAYPAAHRSLWRRIGERGLVLSELPPGTGAWRWAFPARNRIMAALAGMTVVVEAAERSGSLITADLAADLGRDLGAVPGPVSSRALGGPQRPAGRRRLPGPRRPGRARRDARAGGAPDRAHRPVARRRAASSVLAAVERGAATCDAVAAEPRSRGGRGGRRARRLEALGYVSCSLVGVYTRTSCRRRLRASRLRGVNAGAASRPSSRSPARTPAAAPGSRPT